MSWMAWTPQGAALFGVIIAALIGMTIWELKSPTVERRGFLPMPTTRGDRLFIGLLTTAFIHMAWIGLTVVTPWIALAISLVAMAVIGRWG
jgi:predicted small integral membrane protein